jgi:U3 small nucleolar RNA-associated protein 18
LEKDRLKFKRVKDLNHQSRGEGAIIKSLEFHRKENVALVAGNAGVVSLFQVDGRTNAKIQSIKFKDFPLHQAQFAVTGEEFLATSNARGIVQVHNIITGKNSIIPHNRAMEDGIYKDFVLSPDGRFIAFCGRFGYVHLLSARSKEWITSFKMNGEVHALTFSADSSRLYSHGGSLFGF